MKRLLLMLTVLALCLCLFGCGGETEQTNPLGAYSEHQTVETVAARDYISLIFYKDMDTDPLTTNVSENHELLKLVYSPLVRLNGALEVQYVLAESITAEGKSVTVRLREGLQFSDGTPLTAADLAATLKAIRKNEKSPYYARLKNVKSYTATDGRTLSITLREPDVDFIHCLDIPVVSKKDGIGCGPYKFTEQGGELLLIPNELYFEKPNIAKIYLKEPAGEQERKNMFAVGLLDVYFTSAESEVVFSGGKNYRVQTYHGDNLLFVGFNCREGLLANAAFRGYLNRLPERDKLAAGVLLGQADATAYPFQATWHKAKTLSSAPLTDAQKKEKAAALGLNLTEKALLDANGAQIGFTIIVNESSTVHKSVAQALSESLALSGVKLTVETLAAEEYTARLQSGEYQLYLGEVKTGRALNTALYAAGSAVNYGGFAAPALEEAAEQYRSGSITLAAYGAIYDQYTPIMPLAYRQGVLFVAADIGEFQFSGSWSLYGDITKLETKETERAG